MALLRGRRCPTCRSNNVEVVAPINLNLQLGIGLTLLFAAISLVGGYVFNQAAAAEPNYRELARNLHIWNVWFMLPTTLLTFGLYYKVSRVDAKKRHCKNCGKKWKIRSRDEHQQLKDTMVEPSDQPS